MIRHLCSGLEERETWHTNSEIEGLSCLFSVVFGGSLGQ